MSFNGRDTARCLEPRKKKKDVPTEMQSQPTKSPPIHEKKSPSNEKTSQEFVASCPVLTATIGYLQERTPIRIHATNKIETPASHAQKQPTEGAQFPRVRFEAYDTCCFVSWAKRSPYPLVRIPLSPPSVATSLCRVSRQVRTVLSTGGGVGLVPQ